jgi:membrane-associated protein
MGIILPGNTVVILMAVLAATNVLSLWGSISLVVCCVFAGDVSGYLLGRYKGDMVLTKSKRAESEYERHHDRIVRYQERWGKWIVVIGRFMPFIRAITPFTMGIGGMERSRFLPAAAVASLVWGGGFFILGYEFGAHWRELESSVNPAGIIAALVIGFAAWYSGRHPQTIRTWFGKAANWMRARIARIKAQ